MLVDGAERKSSVEYVVPFAERLADGTMVDGLRTLRPGDPDFAKWTEVFDEAAGLSKKEKR